MNYREVGLVQIEGGQHFYASKRTGLREANVILRGRVTKNCPSENKNGPASLPVNNDWSLTYHCIFVRHPTYYL